MGPLRTVARGGTAWWYAAWLATAAVDVAAYAAMTFNRHSSPYWDTSRILVAACLEVAGLVLWRRRPENPVGPLLLGVGLVSTANHLMYVPNSAALVVGWIVIPLGPVLTSHALLLFPDGTFHHRAERAFVLAAYVVSVGLQLPSLLVSRTQWLNGCEPSACAVNPLLIRVDSPLAYAAGDAAALAAIMLGLSFAVVLALRLRRATSAIRRAYRPTLAVIGVLVATYMLRQRATWMPSYSWIYGMLDYAQLAAALALPVGMGYGLLRARPNVADLVTRLERADPEGIQEELAAFVDDPTLRVVLRRANGDLVDLTGSPADPGPDSQSRTVVDTNTWLLHGPALLDDPALLSAVTAAARLTLDKARLQAEVRAQLREARQSRARLARAALDERRRIERDLHDGTQQRLIGVGMSIEHARQHLGDTALLAQALDEAAQEIVDTLAEVRELARGLRPALLVERGLAGAIPVLAARMPLPVDCDVDVTTRLPDDVEATVYFVVSEGLQNVVKHARASQVRVLVAMGTGVLRVEVADDGVGGAVPRVGSGLYGLVDRVAAVAGVLAVTSPDGRGTVLVVDIPLAQDA